jgi:hypothetical protein
VQSGGPGDSNPYSYSNSYTYSHANRDSYSDHNAYCDANSNPHCDCYTYGDANGNRNSYPLRNTYAYPYGRVRFLTGLLEKSSRGMAREPVAAWERHLYPGTIASHSTSTSPREWIGAAGVSGDCGQT